MPVDVDESLLRGAMMVVSRKTQKGLYNLGLWDVNNYFTTNFPGEFNKVTKNALESAWSALRKGPYPITGPQKVREYSFEYWYNYFCREVRDDQVTRFMLAVVKDNGDFRKEEEVHYKRALFADMLQLGFKSFTPADALTAQGLFTHMLTNNENELQRNLQLNLLFRGDGREPERIMADTGTVPQTRIQKLRIDRNMEHEWHPFSRQQWANKVWFRNGKNTDNCLFSAVSVTPQFLTATKFPMLDDLVTSNPGAIGSAVAVCRRVPSGAPVAAPGQGTVASMKQQFNAYANAKQDYDRTHLAAVDRPEKTLLASRTQIYLIRGGAVFNTQKLQFGASEFPEYAMEHISWADHLACLWVIRIHYSKDDANKGHLIVIDKWRWLHDDNSLRLILGDQGFPLLSQYLEGLYNRGKLTRDGLGGIPYLAGIPIADIPASPIFTLDNENWQIERIKDPYLSARGGISKFSQQQTAPTGPPGQRRGGLAIPAAFQK